MRERTALRTVCTASVALILLAGGSLACGGSAIDKRREGAPETQSTASMPPPSPTAAPTEERPPTATPDPTDTPPPQEEAPTATPEPQPIRLLDQGFGQSETEVAYVFRVENPNPGLAVEKTSYDVTLYDGAGAVLRTESGRMGVLLPGQTLAVASKVFLDEGQVVARVEVALTEGESVPMAPTAGLTAEGVDLHPSETRTWATGIIHNGFDVDLRPVRVAAVVTDKGGQIVGGGYAYARFVRATGSAGVQLSVVAGPEAHGVALYPALASLGDLEGEPEPPADASDVTLAQHGFGQSAEGKIGFGLIIENPNAAYAVEGADYIVTATDAEGRVLGVESGTVQTLAPGQRLGVGGDKYLVADDAVARVDMQIMAGEFVASEAGAPFTARDAAFQPDPYFPEVTGAIVNPHAQAVSDLYASAILFDAGGAIVGGGSTYVDRVPAGGATPVEIIVTGSDSPASVELFAMLSALSEFE